MLVAILLAAATTTTLPPPAAGLELTPRPPPRPAIVSQPLPPAVPNLPPVRLPDLGLFGGAIAALLTSIKEAAITKRRQAIAQTSGGVPPNLNVVFIGGYDSDVDGTFDEIVAALGLHSDQIHSFDYRWVQPTDSHSVATKGASNEDIVDGLHGFLAGLAAGGRPIYLVGFSKGGAGIAGLLRRWDKHPSQAVEAVIGAAMLDPPISKGFVGWLQGPGLDFVPNDGGYRPMDCDVVGFFACTDSRAHLGTTAGVEVVAFRNSHTNITNFRDNPAGLRVYDVAMPEPPGGGFAYTAQAHSDVLLSSAVAACLVDEMNRPGSCRWHDHQVLPAHIDDWLAALP